ncbi:hypothetical protein ACEPAG_7478 [Sanghuangporus baumii]
MVSRVSDEVRGVGSEVTSSALAEGDTSCRPSSTSDNAASETHSDEDVFLSRRESTLGSPFSDTGAPARDPAALT